jgi:hypothetical protein
MPKFSFPLIKSSPTDSEYAEICPGGGSRPPCQLKVTAYSGAAPSSATYGNLSVVNLPLKSETADCKTLVEVWLQPGCPPGTPEVVCDDAQNPTEIVRNSSERIYILDGEPPYEWEIIGGHGYSLEWESTWDVGGRPDERLNSWNILYSSADSCGTARVEITDNCLTEVICEFDSDVASDLEYDWVNSAQTVMQSSSATVYVTGGAPPYTWDISGTGFSLQHSETTVPSNTVIASSGACGSGVITVEDKCDFQTGGSIRCSDGGGWFNVADTALGDDKDLACGPMFGVGRDLFQYWAGYGESYRGKHRMKEHYGRRDLGWHYPGICDVCNSTSYELGPTSCLLGRTPLCEETYPWSNPGAGPCCTLAHRYCHYMTRFQLWEWRCP